MGKQADSDRRSLLERLKDTVGRELVFQSPDPISSSSIRQYALAIGDFNPLYTDREFANAHGLKDVMGRRPWSATPGSTSKATRNATWTTGAT